MEPKDNISISDSVADRALLPPPLRKLLSLAKIAAFLIFGIILFFSLSEIFRRKTGGVIDMVHSFYSLDENEVDLLVLGSSHGYSSVDCNVLWGEYGITAYSMCSHGQSVPTSYYLLKEALNYQSPKVVLLETYTFCDDSLYRGEQYVRQAFDGMRLGLTKIEMVEDFFGDAGFSEKLTYYLPFIKYHSRWSELANEDFNTRPYLHGSKLSVSVQENTDPGMTDARTELGTAAVTYFEKIAKLCEEKDISLVLYASPFNATTEEKYDNRQGINNTLEDWLDERGIPFLYFQKMEETGIDWAKDFRDEQHMNTYGATKITRGIGDYVSEQYKLSNHRQDESYASWENDYLLYLQDLQTLDGDIDSGVDDE